MPPLTLTILDPTSLLGRDIAEHLAGLLPHAHRRFLHTAENEEHLIAEVAGEAALVPPLVNVEELSGSKVVVVTSRPSDAIAARLLDWLRDHPEVGLVDATVPGLAPDEVAFVAGGVAAPRRARPWYQTVDPALAGPVRLLASLASLRPESFEITLVCPVSGYGADALEELAAQGAARLSGATPKHPVLLPGVLAFDLAPVPGDRVAALRSQLAAFFPDLEASLQAANAGVFHGHAAALYVEFQASPAETTVRALLRALPGIRLARRNETVRPSDLAGRDDVVCSELQVVAGRLSTWVVFDGLRVGSVQATAEAVEALMAS